MFPKQKTFDDTGEEGPLVSEEASSPRFSHATENGVVVVVFVAPPQSTKPMLLLGYWKNAKKTSLLRCDRLEYHCQPPPARRLVGPLPLETRPVRTLTSLQNTPLKRPAAPDRPVRRAHNK
ncbi:hypothetical protein L596_029525 [Steinernema carpocapsae]|uniref:Uncharacterized protein n=1 Tax=Steinernema carpocapsae TaxID=34508 RepID=A0A4U5LUW4_STECR|nr:hypothetical protein L596_029525 [Steinernema carpocapsae]